MQQEDERQTPHNTNMITDRIITDRITKLKRLIKKYNDELDRLKKYDS